MKNMEPTLSEKVAEHILREINEKNILPGQKLPTEKQLCVITGAGRNTVREALKILSSQNVLEVRQGAGSFVSEKQGIADDPLGFRLAPDSQKLTRDLMQVRLIIEPRIAALAAQTATEADVAELEKRLLEAEKAILQKADFTEQDAAFHSQIACCTHNSVMENLIPVITGGVTMYAHTVEKVEYERTLESHRRIFEAIKAHTSFEAEQEMNFHLLFNQNRYQ